MKILICVALALGGAAQVFAQTTEPSPATSSAATGAEVEALREEVRSLRELVQALQQQVKNQPTADKSSQDQPTLPENPETQTAETSSSAAPSPS